MASSVNSSGLAGPTSAKNDPPAVSAATYGTLDTSSLSTQFWMARIPPKLASVWDDAPEGTVLGTLTFTKGGAAPTANTKAGAGGGGPTTTNTKTGTTPKPVGVKGGSTPASRKPQQQSIISITVDPALAEATPDLPPKYTMEAMTKRVPALHPFTRRPDGSVVVHGAVARTCNLQTERGSAQFRALCKNRLVASVTTNRFVKPVDAGELSATARGRATSGAVAAVTQRGFGSAVQQFGKKMILAAQNQQTTSGGNKRKFEGQTARSVVFELFAQQRYWTVKELRNASGRGEKEIRAVLQEFAEYHRSGEQKNMWELKAEYRGGNVGAQEGGS